MDNYGSRKTDTQKVLEGNARKISKLTRETL